jgi:hypothetical protein
MDEAESLGVYYFNDTQTLLIGIPSANLKATKYPRTVAVVPFGHILRSSKLNIKSIETISITTIENFEIIADLEDNKEQIWKEFLEYRRMKKEKERSKNNLIKFPKDEV